MTDTQVTIIGGGPVGIGLAIELGRRGIACSVVERFAQPQSIPKGQNLTQRAMERFWFWGAESVAQDDRCTTVVIANGEGQGRRTAARVYRLELPDGL